MCAGLICCHVPLALKAELCVTLAALGGSPATAPRVWAALEAAQLVSHTSDKRALNAELHEVHSTNHFIYLLHIMRFGASADLIPSCCVYMLCMYVNKNHIFLKIKNGSVDTFLAVK